MTNLKNKTALTKQLEEVLEALEVSERCLIKAEGATNEHNGERLCLCGPADKVSDAIAVLKSAIERAKLMQAVCRASVAFRKCTSPWAEGYTCLSVSRDPGSNFNNTALCNGCLLTQALMGYEQKEGES